ncbi:MAG TPA: hypothetical protein DCP92_08945 [Nitrospiraceae bacterium]|jgi:hypothetical protein|nr:hypothetical protein [Nitrospiraceae bacterium]
MPEVRAGEKGCVNRFGSIISPFVKSLGIEGALNFGVIEKDWTKIFGEPLSLHTCPVKLQNGELLIYVDSPIWLQQISFYTNDIVKKLSPFAVKEVRLRLGKVRSGKKTDKPQPSVTKYVSVDNDTLKYIEDTLSVIHDLELKESIKKAMEKAFSKRTTKDVY